MFLFLLLATTLLGYDANVPNSPIPSTKPITTTPIADPHIHESPKQ